METVLFYKGKHIFTQACKYLALLGLAFLFFLPIYWVFKGSLQPNADIKAWPPIWVPWPATLDNFKTAFGLLPLARFAFNSLVIALGTIASNVVFCSLAGYTLARKRFWGRDFIFLLIVGTMMIPFHIRLIPMYSMAIHLGLANTYVAQILPISVMGYGVFLMRQFFLALPNAVEDAARIDGCGEWGLGFRIAVPMATPAIFSLALFALVATVEDFLWPMIITTRTEMRPLPTGITMFAGRVIYDWGALLAATAITILPLLIIFIVFQNSLAQGVTAGAVKE